MGWNCIHGNDCSDCDYSSPNDDGICPGYEPDIDDDDASPDDEDDDDD